MEDNNIALLLPLTWRFLRPILLSYTILEVIFLVAFHHILVPRCNLRQEPEEYRSCGRHRHKLMRRILNRMERTCRATGTPFLPAFAAFLHSFFPKNNASANVDDDNSISSSSSFSSDDTTSTTTTTTWPLRGDMDLLFGWAFFGKDPSEFEIWEHSELRKIYDVLHERHGIQFSPGQISTLGCGPMRLCIDPLQPSYRPLIVYLMSWGIKAIGCLVMRILGFRCYTSQSGLTYWYRPQQPHNKIVNNNYISIWRSLLGGSEASYRFSSPTADNNNRHEEEKLLPLLFFHGIAPGGHAAYLPMILRGLCSDGRPILIFENPSISFQIAFGKPLCEEDFLDGICEAVNVHLDPTTPLSVAAHSFGSCQVSWLLYYKALSTRIKQITLLDPVAMLLSEPDVMCNFLYARHVLHKQKSTLGKKIGAVANELFIEHYLRRRFSWYNSELWLEDIPPQAKVLICLSEQDEILNFAKVKREVEIFGTDMGGSMHGGCSVMTSSPSSSSRHTKNNKIGGIKKNMITNNNNAKTVDLITLENAGHAFCVSRPEVWKQLYSVMKLQERIIMKEQACS